MLKARFFDGISPFPKDVKLSFSGSQISFEYIDAAGHGHHLSWLATEVSHQKLSGGSFRKIIHQSNEAVYLELQDQLFGELDQWLETQSVENGKYALFLSRGLMIGILVAAISFFPLFYFFGIPLITDYAAEKIPLETEQRIGAEMAASLLQNYQEQTQRSAYADSLIACLKDELRIPVKIHVVKSDELNAFALPGGQIFVYTAMLDACVTKDEFIALLGHETGHVQLQHTTKSVLRSIIGTVLFSLVVSDYAGIAGVATEQAAQLKDLSYSRELETEADKYSLQLLSRNQINPGALVSLFKVFEKEEAENKTNVPVFLSTHPLTSERITAAREEIKLLPNQSMVNERMESLFQQLKN